MFSLKKIGAPLIRRGLHKGYPLHLHISLLFTLLITLSGLLIASISYWNAKNGILEISRSIFSRIDVDTKAKLSGMKSLTLENVSFLANSHMAEATTYAQREASLPLMAATLRTNHSLSALYMGYNNGDFFILRYFPDQEQARFFNAPVGAAYMVQAVENTDGKRNAHIVFYNADLQRIEERPAPEYTYDPRTRPWFQSASQADGPIQTPPYVYFATQEIGQSIALKSRKSSAVAGGDMTLSTISATLAAQRPSPSAISLLFSQNGDVIYFSENPDSIRRNADGSLDLYQLADIDTPIVRAITEKLNAADMDAIKTMSASGKRWIYSINEVSNFQGSSYYLALAVPEEELMADALAQITRLAISTLLILALSVPATWYLSRRISKDLRTLTEVAQNIRRFNFSDTGHLKSLVLEVQDLSDDLAHTRLTIRRFLDISQNLASEHNFKRLEETVLKETLNLMNATFGVLYLVSDDNNEQKLSPVAARFLNDPACSLEINLSASASPHEEEAIFDIPEITVKDAEKIEALDTAMGGAPYIGEVSSKELPGQRARELLGERALQLTTVPLKNNAGTIIGLLCIYHCQVRPEMTKDMLSFLQQLSGGIAVSIENNRLLEGQKRLLDSLIKLLAGAIDSKSHYTGGHCMRVPQIAKILAKAADEVTSGPFADFHLDDDGWEALRIAAWLHDCGKLTTPEFVVDKSVKLETLYNRIHEIRTRFEVLKRDAEISYWKKIAAGDDEATVKAALEAEHATLDEEFAFVASCNTGEKRMAPEQLERLQQIATRTWLRTLSNRLGLSNDEQKRLKETAEPSLPVMETLLADKPEHRIERTSEDMPPTGPEWGFKLSVPQYRYNFGEFYNLCIPAGTLTDEERYKINDHIVQSIIMLAHLPFPKHLQRVPEIAGGHHERMDGRGYPRCLKGEDMSTEARIMVVADVFEALTAPDRPYKSPKTLSETLSIMSKMVKDGHMDPDLFHLFVTSGAYLDYARQYLRPEQMDEVNIESLFG